jgi:glycosyltransferase involved in cell wall biosynthesis
MARPLHFAQIVSGRVINGAVRHCLMLCAGLADRGHRVTLVHRPQLLISAEVDPRVRRIESALPLRLSGFRSLADQLKAGGVDVTHTHMSDAHAYGVAVRWLAGIPTVATAHSSHLQLHWPFNDRVIAPSRRTAAFHRRVNRVARNRLVVIPNFIDAASRPAIAPEARTAARARLGLKPDVLVVGSVGEINFKKRQSDLVMAVSRMKAEAELVIVGGTAGDAEEKRYGRSMGLLGRRLHRMGARSDVDQLLPAFDIFALASRAEEMPIAVMEAMAAGLPVVATDVGGMADLVVDGVTGLLAPSARPSALAEQLDRLAADTALRARMGAAGRERILCDFAPGPILDRVEAVLEEAADLGQRR